MENQFGQMKLVKMLHCFARTEAVFRVVTTVASGNVCAVVCPCVLCVLPKPELHCLCSAVSGSAGLLTEFLPQHAQGFNGVVAGGGMITL